MGDALSVASGSPKESKNGSTLTINFADAVHSADTDAGMNICGTKSYSLATCTDATCASPTDLGWMSVTADASNSGRWNLKLNPNTQKSSPSPTATGAVTVYFLAKFTNSAYSALGV